MQDDAVYVWMQRFGQVFGSIIMQGHWFGQAGYLDFNRRELLWAQRRKARIFHRSLYSTLLYVKREGLIGLQAANASTQLAMLGEGDEAGTILLQSWW